MIKWSEVGRSPGQMLERAARGDLRVLVSLGKPSDSFGPGSAFKSLRCVRALISSLDHFECSAASHRDGSGSISKYKGSTVESTSSSASEVFRPRYFRREDEGDDGLLYAEPRLVVHIDEHAIVALGCPSVSSPGAS